jgi:hypothetical protein
MIGELQKIDYSKAGTHEHARPEIVSRVRLRDPFSRVGRLIVRLQKTITLAAYKSVSLFLSCILVLITYLRPNVVWCVESQWCQVLSRDIGQNRTGMGGVAKTEESAL